jgi:hypothetical protein
LVADVLCGWSSGSTFELDCFDYFVSFARAKQ